MFISFLNRHFICASDNMQVLFLLGSVAHLDARYSQFHSLIFQSDSFRRSRSYLCLCAFWGNCLFVFSATLKNQRGHTRDHHNLRYFLAIALQNMLYNNYSMIITFMNVAQECDIINSITIIMHHLQPILFLQFQCDCIVTEAYVVFNQLYNCTLLCQSCLLLFHQLQLSMKEKQTGKNR